MEGTYEKVDRILEIRENAEGRLAVAEQEIEQERNVRVVHTSAFYQANLELGFGRKRCIGGAR